MQDTYNKIFNQWCENVSKVAGEKMGYPIELSLYSDWLKLAYRRGATYEEMAENIVDCECEAWQD